MLNKFILSGAVTLGLMTTAIAGPYYAGLSYVDSEFATSLEGNGYAITVGRNLDLLSNVDTAVQITYAELGDDDFLSDEDDQLNADATSTEIAAVFAYDAGFAKPFVILGYEATDIDISGFSGSETIDDDGFYYGIGLDYSLGENLGLRFEMTFDEFTDDLGDELDIETLRLGFVRSF